MKARPVSWDLASDDAGIHQVHASLADNGIRLLPYPFNIAYATTSDIDRSQTSHYKAYTGQIIGKHGLDFGDSVWMQTNQCGNFAGLAFLSPDYSFWNKRTHTNASEFDQHDLFNEYHLGNFDHWHCFLVRGPRFSVLNVREGADSNTINVELPEKGKRISDPYYGTQHMQIAAVGIIHDSPAGLEIKQVQIRAGKSVFIRHQFGQCSMIDAHQQQQSGPLKLQFLPLTGGISDSDQLLQLADIDEITVTLADGKARTARKLVVYNAYSDMLFERVMDLQNRFNIHMNLMTIHGQWMIPYYHTYIMQTERFAEKVNNDSLIGIESLYGAGEIQGLKFSTNCDEEKSFVKIYPELLNNCGISFWRPTGNGDLKRRISEADKTRYCSMLDLVIPTVRRDGGGIYLLTTTMARVKNKTGDVIHDSRTTAISFTDRMHTILDDLKEQPGHVAVLYTHLGNLAPHNRMSSPYFDEGLFARLRKLSHGIAYQATDGPRLWFTRASVISDYALLLRQIAEHVARPEANTVVVKRWEDPYLKLGLPRDKQQMYGLTFYVEDAGKAKVYLEDEAIEELVRNPADETGRESVTVAACGIGRVVLGGLDPALTSQLVMPAVGKQGTHDYDAQTQSLRLHARGVKHWRNWLRGASQVYGLGIHKNDFRVDGAQHMKVVMKRGTAASRIGLMVRTATGGKFYFGDETLLPAVGDVTASYTRGFERVQTGQWTTVIIPFYDLKWHVPESTDVLQVALPANTHAGVDLLVSGDESASVEVQEIIFTRPRTVGARGEKRVVIGGRVKGAEKGTEVRLKRIDGAEDYTTQVETDDLGGFVFSQMSPGGYDVQVNGNPPVAVECWYDRYDIQLRQ